MKVTFLAAYDSGSVGGEELHVGAGETIDLTEAQFSAVVADLGWAKARGMLWVDGEQNVPWPAPEQVG